MDSCSESGNTLPLHENNGRQQQQEAFVHDQQPEIPTAGSLPSDDFESIEKSQRLVKSDEGFEEEGVEILDDPDATSPCTSNPRVQDPPVPPLPLAPSHPDEFMPQPDYTALPTEEEQKKAKKDWKRHVWQHTFQIIEHDKGYTNRFGKPISLPPPGPPPLVDDWKKVKVCKHETTTHEALQLAEGMRISAQTSQQAATVPGEKGVSEEVQGVGLPSQQKMNDGPTAIEIVNADCVDVAVHMIRKEGLNPIVMDAASRYHFGGGYKNGASAQEEELCRRSNLGFLVDTTTGYQKMNFFPLEPRDAIYIPGVKFFRLGAGHDYRLMDEPIECAVGAIAAHNKPPIDSRGKIAPVEAEDTRCMIETFLCMAYERGHDAVVIIALGCGAFQNPAADVANMFGSVLRDFNLKIIDDRWFKKITFAVLDDHNAYHQHNKQGNYVPFAEMVQKIGGTSYPEAQLYDGGRGVDPEEVALLAACPCKPWNPPAPQDVDERARPPARRYGGSGSPSSPSTPIAPPCQFGARCTRKNKEHWLTTPHPTVCRDGLQCRNMDPTHRDRFSHPPTPVDASMVPPMPAKGSMVPPAVQGAVPCVQAAQLPVVGHHGTTSNHPGQHGQAHQVQHHPPAAAAHPPQQQPSSAGFKCKYGASCVRTNPTHWFDEHQPICPGHYRERPCQMRTVDPLHEKRYGHPPLECVDKVRELCGMPLAGGGAVSGSGGQQQVQRAPQPQQQAQQQFHHASAQQQQVDYPPAQQYPQHHQQVHQPLQTGGSRGASKVPPMPPSEPSAQLQSAPAPAPISQQHHQAYTHQQQQHFSQLHHQQQPHYAAHHQQQQQQQQSINSSSGGGSSGNYHPQV